MKRPFPKREECPISSGMRDRKMFNGKGPTTHSGNEIDHGHLSVSHMRYQHIKIQKGPFRTASPWPLRNFANGPSSPTASFPGSYCHVHGEVGNERDCHMGEQCSNTARPGSFFCNSVLFWKVPTYSQPSSSAPVQNIPKCIACIKAAVKRCFGVSCPSVSDARCWYLPL